MNPNCGENAKGVNCFMTATDVFEKLFRELPDMQIPDEELPTRVLDFGEVTVGILEDPRLRKIYVLHQRLLKVLLPHQMELSQIQDQKQRRERCLALQEEMKDLIVEEYILR